MKVLSPEEKKLSVSRVSRALVNGDGIEQPRKALSVGSPLASRSLGRCEFLRHP